MTLQVVGVGDKTEGETGHHRTGRAMAILVASLHTLHTQPTHNHHHLGGAVGAGVVNRSSDDRDKTRTGITAVMLVIVGASGGIEDTRH